MRRGAFPLLLASLFQFLPATLTAADAELRGYLETHCFDCHDSTTKKGRLDLEALPMQLDARERFEKWALVHDRIAAGEMPPKSRKERPSEKENADALKLLDDRLHDADASGIAKTGRALFRRLTTQEFENALRDLLHLPGLRIKAMLPEDERRHGFNKIGQALDLSNVHLSQFMDATDLALTAAIATRSTPPPVLRVGWITVAPVAGDARRRRRGGRRRSAGRHGRRGRAPAAGRHVRTGHHPALRGDHGGRGADRSSAVRGR